MAAFFFDPQSGKVREVNLDTDLRACLIAVDRVVHDIARWRGFTLDEPPTPDPAGALAANDNQLEERRRA